MAISNYALGIIAFESFENGRKRKKERTNDDETTPFCIQASTRDGSIKRQLSRDL